MISQPSALKEIKQMLVSLTISTFFFSIVSRLSTDKLIKSTYNDLNDNNNTSKMERMTFWYKKTKYVCVQFFSMLSRRTHATDEVNENFAINVTRCSSLKEFYNSC